MTKEEIIKMDYVSFMGLLDENNRPPGGKKSIREILANTFLTENSKILHVGCNTGYSTFEMLHLIKCQITGIDINENMIGAGNRKIKLDLPALQNKISFKIANAEKLPFNDETFDLVFSAGSTAFMKNRNACLSEFKRVCKYYGFVADTFLFYSKKPPADLISKINQAINIEIQEWDDKYWLNAYKKAGLEEYYYEKYQMDFMPTESDVYQYCKTLIGESTLTSELHETAINKLFSFMSLFNENHKYLSYGVAIFRKTYLKEQVSLFGS